MAKNSEIIGEYIITINDNNSVEVSRIYKSTKAALKEIWQNAGKSLPEKDWTTHEWGRNVLKELCNGNRHGKVGEFTIEREDNGRINLMRTYSNTLQGLREVAQYLKFPYPDPKPYGWNTQRFGSILVKFAQTGQLPKVADKHKADNQTPVKAELQEFEEDDKYGFKDENGKVVIPPSYNSVSKLENGLIVVENENYKSGIINNKGEYVAEPIYDTILSSITDGRIIFEKDGKWGLFDENGKVIVEPKYEDTDYDFSEGLLTVKLNNLYGFIDINGNFIIEPKYEEASSFSEGLCAVKVNGLCGFIDISGNMVIEPQFKDPYNDARTARFKNGTCRIDTGILITIDKTGKVLKKEKWDDEKSEWMDISDDSHDIDDKKMRSVKIHLYGEGCRLDVYGDGGFSECYNAMRDSEYSAIKVIDGDKETEYSLDDFGNQMTGSEWPEDIYNEDEEKFIDPSYAQFEGKTPNDVFDFGGCDLYEAEDEGVENIEYIQTKISAFVNIELNDGEEFDPKKLHFIYSEFVVPDAEIEVNTGVIYDGKQYDIDLDIDSEREISTETIWEA